MEVGDTYGEAVERTGSPEVDENSTGRPTVNKPGPLEILRI